MCDDCLRESHPGCAAASGVRAVIETMSLVRPDGYAQAVRMRA
jgi:hypothetical protein